MIAPCPRFSRQLVDHCAAACNDVLLSISMTVYARVSDMQFFFVFVFVCVCVSPCLHQARHGWDDHPSRNL